MSNSQAIEASPMEAYGSERLSMDYRVQSIVFHLCNQYKALKILGLDCGNKAFWSDLKKNGCAVSMMQPQQEKRNDLKENSMAHIFISKNQVSDNNEFMSKDFDMAISLNANESFSNPSQLAEMAYLKIRADGLLILAIPYHNYFDLLSINWCRWWNSISLINLSKNNLHNWLREDVVHSLKLNGFKLIESIGVKDNSLQWKALILIARKTK